ncbi:MAG: AAA family ATPase [Candidatus Rokuibacteriota bacterium]
MSDDLEALPVTRLAKLAVNDEPHPEWLVEGLWAARAVGCIGGTPKIGKTWLALELAFAVASGTPCLGRFAVSDPGPVIVYCAEDTALAVKQRVAGLAKARGVNFDRLAVGWVGAPSLHLDDHRDRRRLVLTLLATKPRMLVLDPLVRLHRGDENSAAEISDLLGFLRGLQREHGVAVVLVHHVRKSGATDPGQSLRGSGDLHAWGDSNLYLLRRDGRPSLVAEHRARPAPPPLAVRLDGDPPRLVVDDAVQLTPDPLDDRIVHALRERPLTRTALRDTLGVRNESLGVALDRLLASGRLVRSADGLAVPVPTSGDRRERNGP